MTEKAPERIWRLNGPGVMPSAEDHPGPCFECTKYVRADLAPQWRPMAFAIKGIVDDCCLTDEHGKIVEFDHKDFEMRFHALIAQTEEGE